MTTTTAWTLPANATPDAIMAGLNAQGIVLLPGWLQGADLDALGAEFEELIAVRHTLGFHVDETPALNNVRVAFERLDAARFPVLARIFSAGWMLDVARNFYNSGDIMLNEEVFVGQHLPTATPVPKLPFLMHFDCLQTLKFFLYLRDTAAEDGAMLAVPGSHLANRRARLEAIARGTPVPAIENVVEGQGDEPVPVAGPAGTLFVFDTDVSHKAGHVRPGHERRSMRGHTRPAGWRQTYPLPGDD